MKKVILALIGAFLVSTIALGVLNGRKLEVLPLWPRSERIPLTFNFPKKPCYALGGIGKYVAVFNPLACWCIPRIPQNGPKAPTIEPAIHNTWLIICPHALSKNIDSPADNHFLFYEFGLFSANTRQLNSERCDCKGGKKGKNGSGGNNCGAILAQKSTEALRAADYRRGRNFLIMLGGGFLLVMFLWWLACRDTRTKKRRH